VADHRSVLPRVPGIPWWGAVLLAVTATAVGFAYDAGTGDKTLSGVFSVCYVIGCLLAVLAVRQSGVFSAVIQPPLILFFAVPTAYFVFHGSKITGIKDTLINCGYPLIERFPLMFFTTAVVLLIGMGRWYLGMSARRAAPVDGDAEVPDGAVAEDGLAAVAATALGATKKAATRRGRRHSIDRDAHEAAAVVEEETPQRPARKPRSAAGSARASRSRHARPPETELIEPVPGRPRRPRPAGPPVEPPAEPPRRRTRAAQPRDPRDPREPREARAPRERRNPPGGRSEATRGMGTPAEPRSTHERSERYDRPQRPDRPERSDRYERGVRPERRPRVSDFEPRPTNGVNGSSGSNGSGSHHPVSRVRYRGADDGESRTEKRSRPRRPSNPDADSWQYDV
jgi:hypothetical protein